MNMDSRIMVCVTQQKNCERLIKKGANLVKNEDDLYVVHVAKEGWNFLGNSSEGEALDYLFDISKSVGANLTVLRSADVVKTVVDFAKDREIDTIILGESVEGVHQNGIIGDLKLKLPKGIEVMIVPNNHI